MLPTFFSVVIPCYNRPQLLERALQSCLAQRGVSFEVLVVDDASEVDVLATAEALRPAFERMGVALTCLRLVVNRGAAATRNEGWRCAQGKYVAFLDADDVWHPSKLLVMQAALERTSAACAFHGYAALPRDYLLSPPVALEQFTLHRASVWRGLLRNFSATPCFVVRRSVPERFEPSMRYLEDQDLWLRIARREPLLELVGPPLAWLGRAPMSPGGLSASRWRMRLGEMAMYVNFCRGSTWLLALPALIAWALVKHGYAAARRSLLPRRTDVGDGKRV